jgi:hypothetical protein
VPSPESRGGAPSPVRVAAIEGDEESWTRFVADHPRSTIYHSLAWRDLLERSFGYRSWCLRAMDARTGVTIGVLPLYLVKSLSGRRLVAVPFRDRGGLLWTDAAAFGALVAEAKNIASRVGAVTVQLKTVDPYPAELIAATGLQERFYWVRSTIPLADFAVQPLWERLGAKRRSPIRQAQEAGMVCDDAATDVETWYDLHLQTQQRLGLPPFPLKFFRMLLRTLVPRGAAQLLVAKRRGEALAATILLRHRGEVIYGYAASSVEGQRQAAGDFVLFSALESAIAEGRTHLDLGSDAPSQTGLLFFKRRWFAVQAPIPAYSAGRPPGAEADSSDARYRIVRKGFEYMPRPMLRLAGMATKYFG